ncbi:hypothetical protein SAMN02745866_04060 [Alteromonadaceae bacterium Bs31]|nr:hypothetical protein SAMN02745866_04060 [Alteromonadaceae bacterium Bs31]
MKPLAQKIHLALLTALLLGGCGGDSDSPGGDESGGNTNLQQNNNMTGVINPVTDVDWYSIQVNEPGLIGLNVFNETLRYDVEILTTVYEKDANGDLQRLAADHFPEGSSANSSLTINVNVTQAKTLYIAVRDLDDNDASATETYSISYDVAQAEDNNGSFDTAVDLALDGACHTDSIGTVGDVDVGQFSLSNSGVYEISADFSAFAGGTAVDLKLSLFDNEGTLIRSMGQTENSVYRLVESLPAGSFYVLVHDQGKDDFDTASPFDLCLSSVASAEVSTDDNQQNATNLAGNGHFEITGSIDYAGDQDWSSINSGATPPSLQVLQIEFDPSDANGCDSWFLMEVMDSNDVVLFSKEYSTETGPRTAHIRVESSGEHFVRVSGINEDVCSLDGTVGMAYSATVDSVNVLDDAELGEGNNTINTAIELDETTNTETEALLSYIGDNDWYRITLPSDNAQDRILEIFIETDSETPLEYYVTVFNADEIVDTFTARNNETSPVSFKSSYFIPSTAGNTNSDYFVKIVDLQSDEADIDNNYTIRTNSYTVQTTAPAANTGKVTAAVFNSESAEKSLAASDNTSLSLVVEASDQRSYGVNTEAFTIDKATLANADSTITVTLPWQSGYVDFHKDRDWFKLDIPTLYGAAGGSAESWYVEVQIELYSPAPGSLVEYAWGLYRDESSNAVINEWEGEDGIIASNGDVSALVSALDLMTPAANAEPMWISHEVANVPYYLTVTDIINQSTNIADNDWGYDQAYYMRAQLVFHEGLDRPAD